MRIGRNTSWAAWLLVATVLAGCATQPGSVHQGPSGPSKFDAGLGKTAMSADELRDLQAQPAAEQRRRLDIVLLSDPSDFAARFLRTQAEFELGDVSAVIADSEAVLVPSSLDRHLRLRVLHWRAEALLQANRKGEALLVANQALDIGGSDAESLFTHGWAIFLSDSSQAQSALADLDRALQLDPDQGIGYYRRASVFQAQGKFDLAAPDFERALQLAPDDAPSHQQYGMLLFQTHDFERALAQFDAAARLNPRDPSPWNWRAQTNVSLKRFDHATADANRAIETGATGEDLATAHALLGVVLEERLDFFGAAREYQRSLAINADTAVAYGLARMQWYTGQFAQAIDTLREQAAQPNISPYTPLWLFIVRARAHPAEEAAAKAELAALAPAHQPRVWLDTMVDLMLGKSSLEAALAEADAAPTDRLRAGQRCEADYYAAERLLVHGEDMPASHLLEEALAVCPATYIEAHAAIAEQRLQVTRATKR